MKHTAAIEGQTGVRDGEACGVVSAIEMSRLRLLAPTFTAPGALVAAPHAGAAAPPAAHPTSQAASPGGTRLISKLERRAP